MGRYRAPATPKSPYITRAGYQALLAEQQELWKKRREVVQHLAAAAAEGDRSENAEYIYRKKQLREMDRRIRYLQTRLPRLKVVDLMPDNEQQVFFGAWVTLVYDDGEEKRYRIVGADEFDSKKNWISVDSPMARALLKRSLDERVSINLADRRLNVEIVEIEYQLPE
jgi:transcription elongation factor GreB